MNAHRRHFNNQVIVEAYGASSLSTFSAVTVASTSDEGVEEDGG